MPTFEVQRDETTRLTYSVEAETLADAIHIVEDGPDGDPGEELIGSETVTRAKATVRDGELICPHCDKPTEPTIIETGCEKYWRGAVLTEDEHGKVVCTYGASYETSDDTDGPAFLSCMNYWPDGKASTHCWGEFDPPEGYEIDWR